MRWLARPATLAADGHLYRRRWQRVYHGLLAGLRHLDGRAWLFDQLLHTAVPIAYPLWWLAYRTRGQLAWAMLPSALAVPTAYCFWAMARGAITGKYAYFFIDIGKYGFPQVMLNIAGLVLLFAGLMAAVIAFDRRAALPEVTGSRA